MQQFLFSLKFLFLNLILLSFFNPTNLNATLLNYDEFTDNDASGYNRDDGWTNQLKVNGKKESTKTYHLGSSYANMTLYITFEMKYKGGWDSNHDYFKTYFNGVEVVNDTFSGDASSWKTYTLQTDADNNGDITIKFYANTTKESEYIAIDNVKITTPDIIVPGTTAYHEGKVPFDLINPSDTQNIIGNTQIIGNTVECVTSSFRVTSSDYSNLPCSNDLNQNDNKYITRFINSDTNPSTFNSSTATLKLPDTFKKIAWVGLFWQGHINNYSYMSSTTDKIFDNPNSTFNGWDWYYTYDVYGYNYGTNYNVSNDFTDNDIRKTLANTIQLKIGSSSYAPVTAESLNYYVRTSNANNDAKGVTYSAFANITDYFSSVNPSDNVDITVANVLTTEGLELNLGNYGAWTIVVVYKENEQNTQSKLRNNSVYLGYTRVYDGHPDSIHINDFLLPKSGTVDSQVAVFAGEGEYTYSPDSMSLDGISVGSDTCSENGNDSSCKTNIFDAKLSPSITRNPSLTNNNGIDIDVFDTSNIMKDKRDANPNATSYSSIIDLTSAGDLYLPSMVSFTTELYKPRVCYYIDTIKDSSGTDIFNNGAFVSGSSINSGEKYTFNFWISNMKQNTTDTNVEIAKKVQVYLQTNQFIYEPSSTHMKNIGASNYVNITDMYNADNNLSKPADDLGERNSATDISTWRVGHGATNTEGGQLDVASGFTDTANIAKINMQGSFTLDQSATSINLLNYLTFKASFQTDSITIGADNAQLIVQCQDLNTTGSIGGAPAGKYNAVSTNFNFSTDPLDGNDSKNALHTQVSNQSFNVKILSLSSLDLITLVNSVGDVNVSIIATPAYQENDPTGNQHLCDIAVPITVPITVPINGLTNKIWPLTTPIALKNASIKITSDLNASTPLHSCSRDFFAIRPDAFRVFGKNQYKRAGEDFNLTIKAVDQNNNLITIGTVSSVQGVTDYNESTSSLSIVSQTYMPSGGDITQMIADVAGATVSTDVTTCPQAGTFSIQVSSFTNGEDNASIQFSETGILDINVSEKPGSEFALVDADDTNDTQRYITPATIINDETDISKNNILLFIPYSFVTTATYNTTNGKNWLYMSHDVNQSNATQTTPNMAAYISYTIEAKNKQGNRVKNYTKTCFPDTDETNAPRVNGLKLNTTFDLFLDADINSTANANLSFYTEDNASSVIWAPLKNKSIVTGVNPIQEWISPLNFTDGIGKAKVYFNVDRNISTALNPIKITVVDVNTSTSWMSNPGSPKDFNGTVLNTSYNYVYGRTHAKRQHFVGNTGTAFIYYEAFCDGNACVKTLLPSSAKTTDDPRWFINNTHTSNSDGVINNVSQKGAAGKVILNTAVGTTTAGITTIPLKYTGTSYPYKTTMEVNASKWLIYNKYNSTAQTNEFDVEFINANSSWAGKDEANSTTNSTSNIKSNRRSMW